MIDTFFRKLENRKLPNCYDKYWCPKCCNYSSCKSRAIYCTHCQEGITIPFRPPEVTKGVKEIAKVRTAGTQGNKIWA